MTSILSGCLILLKLAMAVNDGLHTMLSNVYSVIENAMQDDPNMESVEESSSAPAFQRSKSQILEAFNRRRANPAVYEQTDVLVSNLTPFQEITITNKDVEGRRKPISPIKKSTYNLTLNRSKRNVESNVQKECPFQASSESHSSSYVSLGDSEGQSSCKAADVCTQVEETKNDLCRDNSMNEPTAPLENAAGIHDKFPFSSNINAFLPNRASQSNISSIAETFRKSLHERMNQLRLASQLLRDSPNSSNAIKQSTKNIWGLMDSGTTDNSENVSEEVQSYSPTISPGDEVLQKRFLAETTRFYENFLSNSYTCKNVRTILNSPKKSPRTKGSPSSSNSNGNKQTFEDNFAPMVSSNSPPQATNSIGPSMNLSSFDENTKHVPSNECPDSDPSDGNCTGFGNFIEAKPISKVSTTKHINTTKVPLFLKKDSWVNMDDAEFINHESLQKLNEVSTENIESNIKPHSKECFTDSDSDNYVQPKKELFPFNGLRTGKDSFGVSNECQSLIKPNLSSRTLLVCEELDDSGDLEALSLARVDDLTKVLQKVGATEVLGEPNVSKKDMSKLLNDISGITSDINVSSATETKSASASNSKILSLDNIPFTDLDTEEKQINYLNNVTDGYLKEIKNGNISVKNVLFENFELRHKVMLETITNAYKNELDSIAPNAGICLDQLQFTDTSFDIPFIEATSNENRIQTSAVKELDAFGLFFVKSECKVKNTEQIQKENTPSEMVNEAFFKDDLPDLLDLDEAHSESSFAIDCRHNETSTPKKDDMIDNQKWMSINLSSESRKESENTSQDAKSCLCVKERQNSAFNEKDVNTSLIYNGMKYTKDEPVCSPNESNVKDGSTLEARDWGNLEDEMYKNYLKCVSILNMCDDEAEDANMKRKSNCNASDEICNEKSAKRQKGFESKDDLAESDNCNEALSLDSDKTNLNISKETNGTGNVDDFENHESDIVLKKQNVSCSTETISNAGLKCEELSCKDEQLDCSSKSDNALNFGPSVIENRHLNSDNPIDKAEIANSLDHTSGPKEVSRKSSSDAVSLDQLLSSTKSGLVKEASNEPPIKPSLGKKDLLNKEFLLNKFDKEVELYLKCVELKGKSNGKTNDIELIHPTEDPSGYELKSDDQKLNSFQIGKQSMGKTCSYPGKSTPLSNIETLQQREELETTQIYDKEEIHDHETLIAIHSSNSDLPPGDGTQDGFKYEADVPTLTTDNENETLSNIEVINTQTAEEGYSVEGTKDDFDITE